MADLQAQQCQVFADAVQPRQAGCPVGCKHDAVVHIPAIFFDKQAALAKVV